MKNSIRLAAIGLGAFFAVAGCKRETPATQAAPKPPPVQAAPSQPTTARPAATPPQAAAHTQSAPVAPQVPKPPAPAKVTEWAKVKVSKTGAVFLNQKQVSLKALASECARLKQSGGGIMLHVESPAPGADEAQTKAIRQIATAGLPLKAARKASDLN